MTGLSMEPSDVSQVSGLLRGEDIVDNDCDLLLYSILGQQPV